MSNFLIYRFQTKIKKESPDQVLSNFLKDKNNYLSEKERVWWAVSAFWLAIAMQESGEYNKQEINRYALLAIQRLQHQIAHLSLALNLEIPEFSQPPADGGLQEEEELEEMAVLADTTQIDKLFNQ